MFKARSVEEKDNTDHFYSDRLRLAIGYGYRHTSVLQGYPESFQQAI